MFFFVRIFFVSFSCFVTEVVRRLVYIKRCYIINIVLWIFLVYTIQIWIWWVAQKQYEKSCWF